MSKEKTAFAALLEELETMQKSFPTEGEGDKDNPGEAGDDDANIQAAADGDRDGDGTPDGNDPDAGGDDSEYDEMAKALGVKPITVEIDGKAQQAYDGMDVLKAMYARVQALEAGDSGGMLKGMQLMGGAVGSLMKQMGKQNDMLKSLQDQVAAIADQPRGRKAVLSVLEKPGPADELRKSEGLDGNEIMSKALTAQRNGLITGVEVARLDSYLGRGATPPADLLRQIGLTVGG